MTKIEQFAYEAINLEVSDIHLTVEQRPFYRKDNELIFTSYDKKLLLGDIEEFLKLILNEEQNQKFKLQRELDLSWSFNERRFRINIYFQRNFPAVAMRLIPSKIPSLNEIDAPDVLYKLINETQGMLLITGKTGAGKSTTLAAFIKEICKNRSCHVLTLEDPIEFEYKYKNCFISQRELGKDFLTFPQALRSALREMPDVLLVGEIRDRETMSMAMEAASTGIFVLGTLHTKSAAETAMRVESMFSINQRDAVRDQFAEVFTGILSQQLIKKIGGGRVSATEVLVATPASRNLIRQGKYMQLDSVMMSGKNLGMQTMESAIKKLIELKKIPNM